MTVTMKAGRIVNRILTRFGFRLVTYSREYGTTFSEHQLARALTELSAVYDHFMFHGELAADGETLSLLSRSMYTRFETGFYLLDSLRRTAALPGDVCEFGVGQGVVSALIAHRIRDSDRNLWLFDSFEGLPAPTAQDIPIRPGPAAEQMVYRKGWIAFPETMVRHRLAEIGFPAERTRIVRGFIEKTIHGPALPARVSFAYVDFDLYEPIQIALAYLDTVLVPGGIVIIDDYCPSWPGAQRAADEFFAARKDRYTKTVSEIPGGNFLLLQKNP